MWLKYLSVIAIVDSRSDLDIFTVLWYQVNSPVLQES